MHRHPPPRQLLGVYAAPPRPRAGHLLPLLDRRRPRVPTREELVVTSRCDLTAAGASSTTTESPWGDPPAGAKDDAPPAGEHVHDVARLHGVEEDSAELLLLLLCPWTQAR